MSKEKKDTLYNIEIIIFIMILTPKKMLQRLPITLAQTQQVQFRKFIN